MKISPILLSKRIVYLVDRVLLHKNISKWINNYLLRNTLKKVFLQSTGSYSTYVFKEGILDGFADKYNTDKGGLPNMSKGTLTPHSYTTFYEQVFEHNKNYILRVFECGIGSNNIEIESNMSENGTPGASLRMWQEYFPNALIIGADIDKSILFSDERIQCFYLDQTSEISVNNFWKNLALQDFDLMIDDGLHTFEAAKVLFNGSYRYLKSGGMYVIEDISPWSLPKYVKWSRTEQLNFSLVPLFHLRNQPSDDLLLVIRKP